MKRESSIHNIGIIYIIYGFKRTFQVRRTLLLLSPSGTLTMELPNSWQPLRRYLVPAGILTLVQFLFSCYAVLGSATFHNGMSPAVFALLRDVVAMGCFVPALLLSHPLRLVPAPEHWGHFFMLALLGVWGSQLMSALTISCLSAPLYGLLKPCAPVVTLLVAILLGSQRFSIVSRSSQLIVAGVMLSVAGAATIVGASFNDRESPQPALGAFYG
jgi:drug/metabolite transporter (DMT)-like permease